MMQHPAVAVNSSNKTQYSRSILTALTMWL